MPTRPKLGLCRAVLKIRTLRIYVGLHTRPCQRQSAEIGYERDGLGDGPIIDFLQPQRPRQSVGPCNRRGMVVVVISRSGTSRPDDQNGINISKLWRTASIEGKSIVK